MLGWIWIYEGGKIKVKFDILYYYISIPTSHNKTDFSDILRRGVFIENSCSRRDKEFERLICKDYRYLDLVEIYNIIFISAPKSEREIRKREYLLVKQKDLRASIFLYPNRFRLDIFDISGINIINVLIYGELPKKNRHKKIKIEKWLKRKSIRNCHWWHGPGYIPYTNMKIPFFDLLWFLKEKYRENEVRRIIDIFTLKK